MLVLERITDVKATVLSKLVELYTEAFPAEERREISQLRELIEHESDMFFNAVYWEGELAGLFVYWNMGSFYYLEHLAVLAEKRNRKIGQHILDWVKEHLTGIRLLEVEPAETEMAVRRIHYYERNGYHVLDKHYRQPSYVKGGAEFPLWVMGNETDLPAAVLQAHVQTIKAKVYYRE